MYTVNLKKTKKKLYLINFEVWKTKFLVRQESFIGNIKEFCYLIIVKYLRLNSKYLFFMLNTRKYTVLVNYLKLNQLAHKHNISSFIYYMSLFNFPSR